MDVFTVLALGVILIGALSFKSVTHRVEKHDEILRDSEYEKY